MLVDLGNGDCRAKLASRQGPGGGRGSPRAQRGIVSDRLESGGGAPAGDQGDPAGDEGSGPSRGGRAHPPSRDPDAKLPVSRSRRPDRHPAAARVHARPRTAAASSSKHQDAAQAAVRRDQTGGSAPLRLATLARDAAGKPVADVSLRAVCLSMGRGGVPLSPANGHLGRRDGARQDDASDHRVAPVAPCRRGAESPAGLPQAAGGQLAARVPRLGARGPAAGHRGRPGPAPLAMGIARRARQTRQLRTPAPRPGNPGRLAGDGNRLRSGHPRRISADQESPERDQPGGPGHPPAPRLGHDRHAHREQLGRSGRDLRFSDAGLPRADDGAAADGAGRGRLRAAADQGPGAHRPPAQAVPRRRARFDALTAGNLQAGRGRRRAAVDGVGRFGDDPARFRVGLALEADLQLRSRHRGQLQARAARGRSGGSGRQRTQGPGLQPMGRYPATAPGSPPTLRPARVPRQDSAPSTRGRAPPIPRGRRAARAVDQLWGGRSWG